MLKCQFCTFTWVLSNLSCFTLPPSGLYVSYMRFVGGVAQGNGNTTFPHRDLWIFGLQAHVFLWCPAAAVDEGL